ncbi:hypothetical protein JOC26_001214 [Sporohalobacter salinus]|nr:hypothetical protein [Sporohalobacter salinus]
MKFRKLFFLYKRLCREENKKAYYEAAREKGYGWKR